MKNMLLIIFAISMIACKKETPAEIEAPIVNYLKGTKWLMLNKRDSFEFTEDSLYIYQDMSDVNKGNAIRGYGYKFIDRDKIDLEEHYLKYHDTIQDNRNQNAFYPYIYFIRIEGTDLYQAINPDAYSFWGSPIN